MNKRLIAAAIAAMLCTATAHAQWVVVDPTNLVQNTLTAIRTLQQINNQIQHCLLYTSPSPRDVEESRMPSSA